jgi:ubiquinone/menaquinone biosynthesis C-methylase UbiE
MSAETKQAASHAAEIAYQFTAQAADFAAAAELHNEAALNALVAVASPKPSDISLDVACGPGSIVMAFARFIQ